MDTGEICTKICHMMLLQQSKVLQRLLYFSIFCCTFILIFQAGLFVYKFDLHYLIQYGPWYTVTLYTISCAACLPFFSNLTISTLEEIETWTHPSTNPAVIKKNRTELIKATMFIIFSVCSAVFSAICFIFPSDADKEFLYFLYIFEHFFPSFRNVLTWFYKFLLIPGSIITVMSPSNYLVFAVCHFKSQVNILMEYIENIDTGYEDTEYLDARSQDIINERLLVCIKFHVNILRSANANLRETQKFVLPFQFLGTLLMASIVTLAFTLKRAVLQEWSMRIVTLTFAAFFILGGLANGGQSIENLSSDIFDSLLGVQWYKWNRVNRKLYLMFLINVGKTHKIKYSENISLNYNMGVEIAESFFSAMSIVYGLQHNK